MQVVVADYLRETEDILSYEPFLGVADPPQDVAGGARGGVTSRLEAKQCVLLREAHTSIIKQNFPCKGAMAIVFEKKKQKLVKNWGVPLWLTYFTKT